MSEQAALRRALRCFGHGRGAQVRLAEAVAGFIQAPVDPARVNKWLNQGQRMPCEIALAIQALTDDRVQARDLRPDLADFFQSFDQHRSVMTPRFEVGQQAQLHREPHP